MATAFTLETADPGPFGFFFLLMPLSATLPQASTWQYWTGEDREMLPAPPKEATLPQSEKCRVTWPAKSQ